MDTKDYVLTHLNGSRDVRVALFPSIPIAHALVEGNRRAAGYTEADDMADPPGPPSEAPSGRDLQAVCWAAIGLTRPSTHGDGWPDYWREHRRDMVRYGEAVYTRLWRDGYRDASEHLQVGLDLLRWIQTDLQVTAAEVVTIAQGFEDPGSSPVTRSSGS